MSVYELDIYRYPALRSVDANVRSVNHVTTKGKEVDHNLWVWGSVPRALRARWSPAINRTIEEFNKIATDALLRSKILFTI